MKYIILLISILLLSPFAAQASNKISSPDITDGKTELEYRGGWDHDERTRLNHREDHKFVINHGFTDRLRLEFKGVMPKQGDDYFLSYTEWGVRYQLLKSEDYWPRLSLQANYKAAMQDHLPDRMEYTILAARNFGNFPQTANIVFETENGRNARDGTRFNVNLKSQYKYSDYLVPGIEFYLGQGRLGVEPGGAKEVQGGPALSGKLMDDLKYDVGILWGMSDAAPDTRLKWIITYSF